MKRRQIEKALNHYVIKEASRALVRQDSSQNSNQITSKLLKMDGWQNIVTGLGIEGIDKKMSAVPVPVYLTQRDMDNLYQGDDMAARIVDRPVDEMMREGFETDVENSKNDLNDKIEEEFKRLFLYDKITDAWKMSRQYGGAGLIIGILGQDPSLPLVEELISEIEYIQAIDGFRLVPLGSDLVTDLRSKDFGLPMFYTIQSDGLSMTDNERFIKIHHSRIVRMNGVKLPYRLSRMNNFWGDSIFCRLFGPLRNFQSAWDSVGTVMTDFKMQVIKLKNLHDMIASGKDDLVVKRIALASLLASVTNTYVLQEGEELKKEVTSLAGLGDILDRLSARLVAATDLPHTILLGESPSGLGATGESELTNWYDHLKSKQETELRPILEFLLRLVFSQKSFVTGGKIPEKFQVKFCPLWQVSQKQETETRKVQAEIDQIYINTGVLQPEEVSQSRFGDAGYSYETELDSELRNALQAEPNPEDQTNNDPNNLNQGQQGNINIQENKTAQ